MNLDPVARRMQMLGPVYPERAYSDGAISAISYNCVAAYARVRKPVQSATNGTVMAQTGAMVCARRLSRQ